MPSYPTFDNTEFSWDIKNLEILRTEASENNVVSLVDWVYTGNCAVDYELVYGEGLKPRIASASLSGNTTLGPPNPESFIPLNDLQKANVVSWLELSMNVASMQANIKSQIMAIVVPPIPSTYNVTPSWGND